MSYQLKNPLLSGFYPDPSIVRVEDDFYMVTSSFSYFPGVPIFHSRDLANWQQIGHVLDRPTQLPLGVSQISGGIFAPTIRYHEGIYYMITTNVDHGGNFIVTTEDPAGSWSEPHWLKDAEGIDPSLFWDDDGRAYYTGTSSSSDNRHSKIWISEIDLKTFKLVGKKKKIWGGAMNKAWCPEAPHLYKKDGWYYLLIAEGGTEHYHSVTIARSDSVMGEYQGYDGNPILTHRHLGMHVGITNVGHADLVKLRDGSWYAVMLGSRPYGGYHKNMGRETFIAPVVWENEWPVISPGTGRVEWSYPSPDLEEMPISDESEIDHFDQERLAFFWNYLGTPKESVFYIEDSYLKIKTVARPLEMLNEEIAGIDYAGFVGRRQQHMSYTVQTELIFGPEKEQTAGLAILQNNYHTLRIEMALKDGKRMIRVIKGYVTLEPEITHRDVKAPYKKEICGQIEWDSDYVVLELKAEGQKHTFSVIDEDGERTIVALNVNGGFLGSETAGGFVGAYIGMFASGNGKEETNYAAFDSFSYYPDN